MPSARRKPTVSDVETQDPMIAVRTRADALYRAAAECCRQHDRAAKLHAASEPELEHEHLDALCKMCDGSLLEMAEAYSKAAGSVQPTQDQPWWHKANNLWHASREYARRHAGCEELSTRPAGRHRPEELGSMQMEYELEASALLALRQAADAYRKVRPDLA
jgi:hypothetical protein